MHGHWRHEASGWEVKHCGHPTANWPYYAIDPRQPAIMVVASYGRGFRKLAQAMGAVEDVLAGNLVLTQHQGRTDVQLTTEPSGGTPCCT